LSLAATPLALTTAPARSSRIIGNTLAARWSATTLPAAVPSAAASDLSGRPTHPKLKPPAPWSAQPLSSQGRD
jgi:hypothetical protein